MTSPRRPPHKRPRGRTRVRHLLRSLALLLCAAFSGGATHSLPIDCEADEDDRPAVVATAAVDDDVPP